MRVAGYADATCSWHLLTSRFSGSAQPHAMSNPAAQPLRSRSVCFLQEGKPRFYLRCLPCCTLLQQGVPESRLEETQTLPFLSSLSSLLSPPPSSPSPSCGPQLQHVCASRLPSRPLPFSSPCRRCAAADAEERQQRRKQRRHAQALSQWQHKQASKQGGALAQQLSDCFCTSRSSSLSHTGQSSASSPHPLIFLRSPHSCVRLDEMECLRWAGGCLPHCRPSLCAVREERRVRTRRREQRGERRGGAEE